MTTIKEIARLADVSPSTVSNVFNGRVPVREKTRKRVLAAAQTLGYVPNTLASNLRRRETKIVAFSIGDIANPSHSFLVRGASDVFLANDYHPLIMSCDEDPVQEQKNLRNAAMQRVAGLLVSPTHTELQAYSSLLQLGISIVCVDRRVPGLDTDVVRSNDVLGFQRATKHFVEQGHRSIALITGPAGSAVSEERKRGYFNVMNGQGLPIKADFVQEGPSKERFGYEMLTHLMTLPEPPSAIIAASTRLTLGVLYAMRDHGFRRPQDVALIGSVGRDLEWMSLFAPPLTVVAQPSREVGQQAAELLLSRIMGDRTGPGHEFLIDPELIVRAPQPAAAILGDLNHRS